MAPSGADRADAVQTCGRRDEPVAGTADGVPPAAPEDRWDRTPLRARSFHFPDPELTGVPPSRDRTLVVLAGAVDDSGEGTRLVQVVDHLAVAGHADALLLVGADGPEEQVEVWRLRVAADRDTWLVAAAGCPVAGWPRWDHLVVESVGLPASHAVDDLTGVAVPTGPVEVLVHPVDAEPSGLEVQDEPGRTLGRLLAAIGWDLTPSPDVPAAPDGAALVDADALDALLLDGHPEALDPLAGPWAQLLARCARSEVVRWRVGAVEVVDCGARGLLRIGAPPDLEGDGRRLVPVTGVTRVEAFALAAGQLGRGADAPVVR